MKKLKRLFAVILCLTLMFTSMFITVSAANDFKMGELDKGYITFIFDDGKMPFTKEVAELFKEFGMPMSCAIIAKNVERDGELHKVLLSVQENGGEILSHGYNHKPITSEELSKNPVKNVYGAGSGIYTYADIDYELGQSWRYLTSLGFNVNGMIEVGCGGDESSADYALVESVARKYYKYSNASGVSAQYTQSRRFMNWDSLETVKKRIDNAANNNTWQILSAHGYSEITSDHAVSDTSTLREILQYIKDKKGAVEVVTWNDMYTKFGEYTGPQVPSKEALDSLDGRIRDYYVGYGGTGDGSSLAKMAPDVATAITTMNINGLTAKDTANIWIVQDISAPLKVESNNVNQPYHNLAYWGGTVKHQAKIVIKPYAENQKANTSLKTTYLAMSNKVGSGDTITLGGPTEFENLKLVYCSSSNVTQVAATTGRSHIISNGYNLTLGSGISYGYIAHNSTNGGNWTGTITDIASLGIALANVGGTYENPIKLIFKSKLSAHANKIEVPSLDNTTTNEYTFKKDVTLEFDNAETYAGYVRIGSFAGGTSTFEKNLNFKIKNANQIRFENGGNNVVVKGGVQFIVKNGVSFDQYAPLNITKFVKEDGSKADVWYLKGNAASVALIDFVEGEKGKFQLPKNAVATATNVNDTSKTYKSDENGLLDLSALAGEYTVEVEVHRETVYDFYVQAGGTGDGMSPESPVASVEEAIKVVKDNGELTAKDTANIWIVQDIAAVEKVASGVTNKPYHNLAYWGNTVQHDFRISVKPYSANQTKNPAITTTYLVIGKQVADQATISLGGPTEFDDLKIVYTSSSNLLHNGTSGQAIIVANGNDLILGSGISYGNIAHNGLNGDKWDGTIADVVNFVTSIAADGGTYDKAINIKLNLDYSANANKFEIPSFDNATTNQYTFKEDITVEVNNPNIYNGYIRIGSASGGSGTLEKNLNFRLTEGLLRFQNGTKNLVVKGGVQFIAKESMTFENSYSYTDITKWVKADGSKADVWYLKVAKGNLSKIDFIDSKTGKFAIKGEYQAIATKGDTVLKSQNGVLDLSGNPGEYTVQFVSTKDKTMLFVDDAKTTTSDLLVLKTKALEANVEYTVSFDYKFNGFIWNQNMYFGVYGGVNDPGSLKTINQTFYTTREGSAELFSTIYDNGSSAKYTFTLTEEQVDNNPHYYAGIKFLPGTAKTQLYLANFTLYKSSDNTKTNLLLSDEYETSVANWYSHWGSSSKTDIFTRSNIEFTAKYLPYNADLFESPMDIHYGDNDLDGRINILDLVRADEAVNNGSDYTTNLDANANGKLDGNDVVTVKNHLIGLKTIEWVEKGHGIMEGASLSGGADNEANALRNQIASAADTLTKASASNTIYYVAENGKDSNDGKSESKPITINKVYSLSLKSGDLVLFKRGDTFRLPDIITPVNGVGYGAYGTGAKPKLLGSLKNYADKDLWTTTNNRLWKLSLDVDAVTQIIFDEGEYVGFMKDSLDEVNFNGDFYYDTSANVLYLYLNQINPGKHFESIEIATTDRAFNRYGNLNNKSVNIKFENLDIRYFALFGMNLYFTENVSITNCEFGFIGGGYTGSGSRYGNAIQLWRHANNTTVSNNYIYQVFDAAITFQGSTDNDYTNLTFKNNLIEYCSMNFEFWGSDDSDRTETTPDPDATMHNIAFENNIVRFSGYGFGGMQRKTQLNQAFVLAWNNQYESGQIKNFTIKNNIFDTANSYFYYGVETFADVDISSNVYYQQNGSNHTIVKGQKYYVSDKASFEEAIKEVDSNPTKVEWIG